MSFKSLPLIAVMMFGLAMPVIAATSGSRSAANTPSQSTDSTIVLDGITVSARLADRRTSPLRLTDISRERIITSAAGKTFPELIHNVPGVYATAETGSFGDAKINIRGFKQENISVLLNGIPISGLTSGSMYWNNWMGMADASSAIQVQKGIGNSMLSDNSVGGTINIITTQPSGTRSAGASMYLTDYGTRGVSLNLDSGDLPHGWAVSFMGSHNWGSSYAEMTGLSTWSYSLAVNKRWNDRHSLNFTALGSPEQHEQRSQRLSFAEVEKYGRNYSKNWGWYTAEDGSRVARTLSRNNYFKPYFTLTHTYGSERLTLSSTAYLALADGGGYYTESKGRRIAQFIGSDGHIDWDAAAEANRKSGAAINIMSDYLAGHTQAGLRSSAELRISEAFTLETGLHFQYYGTWEKERITDLLGADYWFEDYSKSLAGEAGRNCIKHVGDYIRTDNGRNQEYGTLYALATWKSAADVVTAGVSASGTMIRRWDRYNYVGDDFRSGLATSAGASIKTGWLHNFSAATAFYANAAAYSRAPYASVFFQGGSNEISKDIVNEKNYLAETGLRRSGDRYSFELTAYYAYWKDKTLMSQSYRSVDVDPFKYMVRGLDAEHFGLEAEGGFRPLAWLSFDGFASLGQWKWKKDVSAVIYDPDTMLAADEIKVYADGLHVGDAPQTQLGVSSQARIPLGGSKLRGGRLTAKLEYSWNDRLWADFDPVSRTNPSDRSDSYRLPSYSLLNASLVWEGNLLGTAVTLWCNGGNLTDALYIERSKDGSTHDAASFTGYWGNGRSVTFGIRISL